ncbi:MAG: cytochrome c oxidase assembly protein [Rhodospirillaceae bacterium]|jgi:cytochrome c oxidase assembly protein subunit 11|nr:cytochrome c oxidase assembly protein [Rhodospirillaceae bacterium]MBT5242352.1 cytochrome c oxidase assembly protein [Rhodospirillaceae bacterium]MBT5567293.1 cytochrome c oxidase assembly protein [Rhodospirillaceae bacterium]MBT6091198.1 cytochrome c oxidase assembly protein [Rhodospirillaceae bacterium]MBT6960715.1 cytochrome c oxidase assembly protein [Rhodospirillaceae bacterium]
MSSGTDFSRRNRRTATTAFVVVAGMVGLTFAFVPLYTLICQVTGLGGTPQVAERNETDVSTQEITVRFDANVDRSLPWDFAPNEASVTINLGAEYLTSYRSTNLSDEAVTGISTFNVTPLKAAQYFTKIECFCFTEQTLEPGQSVDMPVTFYIDPAILEDELANEVQTITLSYTFYRTLDDIPDEEPEIISEADQVITTAQVGSF